ncbi:MAG: MFS transporter [Candidatus Diapherotrites archaeon]
MAWPKNSEKVEPTPDEKEVKRTVKVFSIASFFNDLGSDMIYPLWPLFVTSVLGANVAALGLIDGLGDALVSISQGISGYYSDKWQRRKPFIWIGYLAGGFSRLGYAFSTAWQQLVPLKILDRAGKMRGAPRDAIVADVSTHENRGTHFGLLRAADNGGAVVGIILAIILVNFLPLPTIFLLAAIPSFIGAALIFVFIKDRKAGKIFKGFSFKNLSRDFKLFVFSSTLFSLAAFSYSFLLLAANDAGYQAVFIPVLYLVFTLCAAIFSLYFGKLADRIGRKKVLYISYAFYALMAIGFAFTNSLLVIFFLFVLLGLHRAALEPVQKTFAAELSPEETRATGLGAFQLVYGLAALPASVIAGALWLSFGRHAPFIFAIALTAAAALSLTLVKEKK